MAWNLERSYMETCVGRLGFALRGGLSHEW
jgi:hypothetical protein